MKIQASSPCRVDLAGGTLDLWPLYLFHDSAVTVNFAVDRYTRCWLSTRNDGAIHLKSRDLGISESFASLEALMAAKKYPSAFNSTCPNSKSASCSPIPASRATRASTIGK